MQKNRRIESFGVKYEKEEKLDIFKDEDEQFTRNDETVQWTGIESNINLKPTKELIFLDEDYPSYNIKKTSMKFKIHITENSLNENMNNEGDDQMNGREYKCDQCNYVSNNGSNLARHKKGVHQKIKDKLIRRVLNL